MFFVTETTYLQRQHYKYVINVKLYTNKVQENIVGTINNQILNQNHKQYQ